jgi:hypothetical protein
MPEPSAIRKIAFLGDYLPREWGIATFTTDLRCAVAAEFPAMQCLVVPVNDLAEGYDYPPEVRFEIAEQDLPSYLRAADFFNRNDWSQYSKRSVFIKPNDWSRVFQARIANASVPFSPNRNRRWG